MNMLMPGFKKLYYFLLLVVIYSCNEKKGTPGIDIGAADTAKPPVITELKSPRVILLKDRPKTIVNPLPQNPSESYYTQWTLDRKRTKIIPPKITKADFLAEMQVYNTEQIRGLNNIISAMLDSKGNLWFGTQGTGLIRYNGMSFQKYSTQHGLGGTWITSIFEDSKGNLWMGILQGGFMKYDGRAFTNYTASTGYDVGPVRGICEDNEGMIWLSGQQGALRFDGKAIKNYTERDGLVNNFVWDAKKDSKGNIWFATNYGISKWDGKTFTNYSRRNGFAGRDVRSIFEDSKGNLWFSTLGTGVFRFDGNQFTNFTTEDGLLYNAILCTYEDRNGYIWFGSLGGGVSRYDGKQVLNITTKQGLSSNNVEAICEDVAGNLWICTTGGGVNKYNDGAFLAYTNLQGLPDNVIYCLNEDQQGNIWMGTQEGGLVKFDGQEFTQYTTEQGMYYWLWGITVARNGDLWLGTYGEGACRFDGSGFTYYSKDQGLVNDNVYSVLEDRQGNFWFSAEEGFYKLSGDTMTVINTENGLPVPEIYSAMQDRDGYIWLATYGGGISRFDGKTFTTYGTDQGLSNRIVYCILQDKEGNLWIATHGGGVNRFDGKTFISYNTDDGLSANPVYGMAFDRDGNLVMGTDDGVTVLTGYKEEGAGIGEPVARIPVTNQLSNQELKKYKPAFEIFNRSTGYPIKSITDGGNNGAVICDHNGKIWIGTREKLLEFDYAKVGKKNKPLDLEVRGVQINNESVIWYDLLAGRNSEDSALVSSGRVEEASIFGKLLLPDDKASLKKRFSSLKFDSISTGYPVPYNLVVPHKLNTVTIDFGAIELVQPYLVKYQYMLEGYDRDWSPVLDKTSATFGNIREGKYTFKVRALSPEGIWSEPISYSFRVLPPWYRTWWMYILYVLGGVGLIVVIFRWRTAALRKEKEILEQKVKERTAEVVAQKNEAERQRKRSDELLLNILPAETAEELKNTGTTTAKDFDQVTVLFTDFKNFSKHAENLNASELVEEINYCYSAFDQIITKHRIEKIKTIGDSYMCAGGLPVETMTNAIDTIRAALEIRDFMINEKEKRRREGKSYFEIRIGLHTGPVVAGIVGIKKFAYDIWGDTVNIASRMESSGSEGKVNISGSTFELVKDQFECVHRGKIEAKNKGMIDMYYVEGEIANGTSPGIEVPSGDS